MSKPEFLFDECTDPDVVTALRRLEPAIGIIRVGDQGAPPRSTLDPEMLLAAESLGRVLVTNDRRTMPGHLIAHFLAGRHTAGVILLREGFAIGRYARSILDQWAATTADEWIDRTTYLP